MMNWPTFLRITAVSATPAYRVLTANDVYVLVGARDALGLILDTRMCKEKTNSFGNKAKGPTEKP